MEQRLQEFSKWMRLFQRLNQMGYPPSRAIFLGPPSSGKTALLQSWLSTQPEPFAMLITAVAQENPKQLCHRLLAEHYQVPSPGAMYHLRDQLGAFLRETSIRLLIIDQAERCSTQALVTINYLMDWWKVPLIFVGQPKLEETLERVEYASNLVGLKLEIEQLDRGSLLPVSGLSG